MKTRFIPVKRISPAGFHSSVSMETDLKRFDANDGCEMESTTDLLFCEDEHDLFGVPRITPRVGDSYQVEIPSVLSDIEYDSYVKYPCKEDYKINLPIPVMWIDHDKKGSDGRMENGCLVPGKADDSLNEVDEAGVVLGLYIFGKNLVQIKRLLENKTMGTILAFYYGKFYRSNGYRRWSEGRKTRSRKFIHGPRIFSGFRQQELLSRLSEFVSEEDQNMLSQVSKSYSEGKTSLEEYVFILKSSVGMKNLVEAIGIGKGKQDLTRASIEPTKSNNHSEASSSFLMPTQIVKLLTGDLRLSKAKTNDLFWESVWPRLLARGWQSEQPKDYNYAATLKNSNSLVFLVPGVVKFSRRNLVKGKDYFDSITDVLNKVVSDPTLLELDEEMEENNRNGNVNDNDLPYKEHRCYLRPRLMNQNLKFTVVDTSMVHDKPFKVKELRTEEESSGISSEDTNYVEINSSKAKTEKKRHKEASLSQRAKKGNSKVRKRKKLASCNNRGMELDNNRNHIPVNSQKNNETTKVVMAAEGTKEQQCVEMRKDHNDAMTTSSNIVEEQNNMNPRRYGTRNRPPTMRALEALANGFLTVTSKKKDIKTASGAHVMKQNPNKKVEPEDVGLCHNTTTTGGSRKFFALNETGNSQDQKFHEFG